MIRPLDEYFVALKFCDRSDGAIWWWCDVVVDSVCKPLVRRLFDLAGGGFRRRRRVRSGLCCPIGFRSVLGARLCLVDCVASLREGWRGLCGPEACHR